MELGLLLLNLGVGLVKSLSCYRLGETPPSFHSSLPLWARPLLAATTLSSAGHRSLLIAASLGLNHLAPRFWAFTCVRIIRHHHSRTSRAVRAKQERQANIQLGMDPVTTKGEQKTTGTGRWASTYLFTSQSIPLFE